MHEHIIFFDGECPFCHRSVRHIIDIDIDNHFLFAPLAGVTAREILIGPQEPLTRAQSLVLVENYQSTERNFYVRSKAIFRTYWLVGNSWGFVGILSFLPCWFSDLIYRWLAAHRHQFKLRMPKQPGPKDRFLP
jgi:predicted DCC family thiol-disulfide oxidoreductase YuxK